VLVANGSVKRKGSVWSFVVDLGPDPATGRRRQARRSGFATKKAAEAALRDLATAAEAGTSVSRSRITVSQFLTDWLETIKPRIRETTWVSYRMAVERIARQVGAVQLQSLTPLQVESLYATLLERGGAGGRSLAPKTVRNCHIVLRRALADAERLGLVTRNPAAVAKTVSAPRVEQKTWSSEEIQRFFDAVAGERLSMAFVLLATTGMHRGEVLGLRWEDVDLDERALSIVQTLTTVSGRVHIGPPKTGKSRRRVSLDTVTFDALKAHRTRQLEERLAAGDAWSNDGDLVFTDELGGPVHPDRFSRLFDRIARDAELPRIRLHDLRHSYATLALKAGVHPKVVSERLGHSTIAITLDLYSHVAQGLDADAAELIAARIYGTST
jgi:integrase